MRSLLQGLVPEGARQVHEAELRTQEAVDMAAAREPAVGRQQGGIVAGPCTEVARRLQRRLQAGRPVDRQQRLEWCVRHPCLLPARSGRIQGSNPQWRSRGSW